MRVASWWRPPSSSCSDTCGGQVGDAALLPGHDRHQRPERVERVEALVEDQADRGAQVGVGGERRRVALVDDLHPVDLPADDGGERLVLGLEVAVEPAAARGQARRLLEVGDGRAVDAAGGERLQGGVEDPVPRPRWPRRHDRGWAHRSRRSRPVRRAGMVLPRLKWRRDHPCSSHHAAGDPRRRPARRRRCGGPERHLGCGAGRRRAAAAAGVEVADVVELLPLQTADRRIVDTDGPRRAAPRRQRQLARRVLAGRARRSPPTIPVTDADWDVDGGARASRSSACSSPGPGSSPPAA